MKMMILTVLTVLSSSAFAQEVVLKECSVKMKQVEANKTIDMKVKVIKKGNSLLSTVTQAINSETIFEYKDVAEVVEENSIRANLTAQSDPRGLNKAEGLIVHAMMYTGDPDLIREFSAEPEIENGFWKKLDLTKVRSAKIYIFGKATNLGLSAIVEARDANNQVMGSFLAGFLVSACK